MPRQTSVSTTPALPLPSLLRRGVGGEVLPRLLTLALAAALAVTLRHPAAAQAPTVTGLSALHHSGQTFITWTERADMTGERYRIYRSGQPITAETLLEAQLLYEVAEGSSRFYADRYRSSEGWKARYLQRFVLPGATEPIAEDSGLLVWTLAPEDFGGAAAGEGYYAVMLVTVSGSETVEFAQGSTTGPVSEGVADPAPVEVFQGVYPFAHVYIQYLDLRRWNLTFTAPNPGNGYYGLDPAGPAVAGAIQYAFTYTLADPNPRSCGGTVPVEAPLLLYLHPWGEDTYGPEVDVSSYCAYELRPIDVGESWWFGFARDHDYRASGDPPSVGPIVNYTEQRVLRMVYDLLHDPQLNPSVDRNRVYVYGHSMGGAGALALAQRYPDLFAAAYASEPMADFRRAGGWQGDIVAKWGAVEDNLPVELDGPAGWGPGLSGHSGESVWDWQDLIAASASAGMAPLGLGLGLADDTVAFETQGAPLLAALEAAGQPWAAAVSDDGHTWQGFAGLPPALGLDDSGAPFGGLRAVLDETVPGLRNLGGGPALPPASAAGYHQTIEWAASWSDWGQPPLDTENRWEITLRTGDGSERTVDVTPRRLQAFRVLPGTECEWENRRLSDGAVVASGTIAADELGLLTVSAFTVSGEGNRLALWPAGVPTPTATATATATPTATATLTATPLPTVTKTSLPVPTATRPAPTATPSATPLPEVRETWAAASVPSAGRSGQPLLVGLLSAAVLAGSAGLAAVTRHGRR